MTEFERPDRCCECGQTIYTPNQIAIAALRLGSEGNMCLWDVRDLLGGAVSDQAWRLMWEGMQAITAVEGDYYQRMALAADYLEETEG